MPHARDLSTILTIQETENQLRSGHVSQRSRILCLTVVAFTHILKHLENKNTNEAPDLRFRAVIAVDGVFFRTHALEELDSGS